MEEEGEWKWRIDRAPPILIIIINALFMTTGRKRSFFFFFLVLVARTHGSRIEGRDGREEIMEAREGEKGKGEKGNKRKGIQLWCVSFDLIRFDRSVDERELRLHLIDYVYPWRIRRSFLAIFYFSLSLSLFLSLSPSSIFITFVRRIVESTI